MPRRQLLDCGQRHECRVHHVSCWNIQPNYRINVRNCLSYLPCWSVLPRGLQLVERERAVCCGQLLDCGQRHECFMRALPCRSILPCWLWE